MLRDLSSISQTLSEQAKKAITRAGVYNFLAMMFRDASQGVRLTGGVHAVKDFFTTWRQNLHDYDLGPALMKLETALAESGSFQPAENGQPTGGLHLFHETGLTGLPPYETEYSSTHVFAKSQDLADIAGFYRAFGFSSENRERPDHVSAELEFMRVLCLMESYAEAQGSEERLDVAIDAQRKFMTDHLGRWFGFFCEQLAENSNIAFYRTLAEFSCTFIAKELQTLRASPVFLTRKPKPSDGAEDLSMCGGCG